MRGFKTGERFIHLVFEYGIGFGKEPFQIFADGDFVGGGVARCGYFLLVIIDGGLESSEADIGKTVRHQI